MRRSADRRRPSTSRRTSTRPARPRSSRVPTPTRSPTRPTSSRRSARSASTYQPAPGSDVGPSSGTDFTYPLQGFALGDERCPSSGATCTWDPSTPFSWQANREQDAVQLFWLVNAFHDHLAAPPIGFGAADGAFEGDDPMIAQSMDGADTAGGLPDEGHSDNAYCIPLPDGEPGFMSIFLVGAAPAPFGPSPLFSLSGANDAETSTTSTRTA